MTRRFAVGAALLLALVAACGGATQPTAPSQVIALALPDRTNLPDETKTVHLAVGQILGVQTRHGDGAGYWTQTNGGNNAVLTEDGPSAVTSSCPTDVVGCGSTSQQLYRAAASGTSTVEWRFVGLGPGLDQLRPGQLSEPCRSYPGKRCPIGRVRITVTVA